LPESEKLFLLHADSNTVSAGYITASSEASAVNENNKFGMENL